MSDLVALPAQPRDTPWPTVAWPEGAPRAEVDRAALDGLLDHALAQPADLGQTNAVVVVHGGRIVAERYADDVEPATPHISWSMAKSILHAAVGLLVGDGRLTLDAPSGLPYWSDPGDPRRAITLDQLLEMRSGLRFREDYVDDQQSDVIEMLFQSGKNDVARFAAGSPLEHPPGSFFSYSSGTSNLVSAMVSGVLGAGEPVERFLRERLFEPVGMASPSLRFDEAGTWIASSFVFATARDFARFGLLYLRDGMWQGRRLLPPGWVDRARRLTAPADRETFAYGAHWWVVPGSLGVFQAQGYNGQRITVVPGLDLVVVRLGVTPADLARHLNTWMKGVVDAFRPAKREPQASGADVA